ncbi:MAG: beta-Ala-His dipeptidase, partial [Flavobacteriales bacterium]
LESSDIPHPPLEALFTIDEETGMTGAKGLETGLLKGEILLNLDTEEDDELDIGCAGGIDVTAKRTYLEEAAPVDWTTLEINVKGLMGGHSGIDIDKGLGNANKIMNRLLYHASSDYGIRIGEISGGSLRNAIPRESCSKIVVASPKLDRFSMDFKKWSKTISNELSLVEPDLLMTMSPHKKIHKVMAVEAQKQLLQSLYAAHNGVYTMSAAIPDLVETSNNVAKVEVENGSMTVACLTRSSVDSAKIDLANALKCTFELAGFEVVFGGQYPGWNPDPNSPILLMLKEKYKTLFNQKPKVVACHAGLECGILAEKYPELDMISFGPTIKGAHSPDERVNIVSVQKFWTFLLAILKDIPKA